MQRPPLPSLYGTYLRHLLHLRLMALGGQALAYVIAATQPHFAVPAGPLGALGFAVLLYTLVALQRLPRRAQAGAGSIVAETGVDLVTLTASLGIAGGSSNPLVLSCCCCR